MEKIRGRGLFSNVVMFNVRISGLFRAGKVLEAHRIFRDMKEDKEFGLPKPNQITYNLMLDGFCREGIGRKPGVWSN